ncbi:sigma factor G inhibitor Gin [Bacillus marasmi]|uniref:sigma factor G inhibitor Gin n=1 Tax=Bacillus marasmi TaxID=1926279 RepID=UPI0011C80C65|nr:sigma factor G inhibitor Gin [Bacillus marasmi]
MEVGILNSQHLGEKCVICQKNKLKGIHLYTSYICTDCETDLIKTETDDPKYRFYVQQLKKATTPEIYS